MLVFQAQNSAASCEAAPETSPLLSVAHCLPCLRPCSATTGDLPLLEEQLPHLFGGP